MKAVYDVELKEAKATMSAENFIKAEKRLYDRTQRVLSVLNPAHGERWRGVMINTKNFPADVRGRLSVTKLQILCNNLTYLGPVPERVMLIALKAFLLLNGFDTTKNSHIENMSDAQALAVGFLPRVHAAGTAQYPFLFEANAMKEMAEGYAYRSKVPAPKSLGSSEFVVYSCSHQKFTLHTLLRVGGVKCTLCTKV
jgi:hypothetical protein